MARKWQWRSLFTRCMTNKEPNRTDFVHYKPEIMERMGDRLHLRYNLYVRDTSNQRVLLKVTFSLKLQHSSYSVDAIICGLVTIGMKKMKEQGFTLDPLCNLKYMQHFNNPMSKADRRSLFHEWDIQEVSVKESRIRDILFLKFLNR